MHVFLPSAGGPRGVTHVSRRRPKPVSIASGKASSRRGDESLYRRLLRLRRNMHRMRRCLHVRTGHRASAFLHTAQSRLRGSVQRDGQYHGPLEQGRSSTITRGAPRQLRRVLPRLREFLQRARQHASALQSVRRSLLSLCRGLHGNAERHADADVSVGFAFNRPGAPAGCRFPAQRSAILRLHAAAEAWRRTSTPLKARIRTK